MRIGYAKLGRSMKFTPEKFGPQGDPAAPQLLERLAHRNPDVEWVVVGRNDGAVDRLDTPGNVTNPWPTDRKNVAWYFVDELYQWVCSPEDMEVEQSIIAEADDLDGIVVHLGQHGTSDFSIPMVNKTWDDFRRDRKNGTKPLQWARNYGGYLDMLLNRFGDRTDGQAPVVYICEDPRNYLKTRSIKWPTGTDDILAQSNWKREQTQDRFEDPRRPIDFGWRGIRVERRGEVWIVPHTYRHSGAEMMILPSDWETWGKRDFYDRGEVGIASSSFWVHNDVERRSWLIKNWMLRHFPDAEVYGKFDGKSLADLDDPSILKENTVAEFPGLLGSWRATMSLPALGSGWAVAKPWQCFAARVVTFMVGQNDDQGWVMPSLTRTPGANLVGPGLWSVRDDWTPDDIMLAQWLRVRNDEEFANRVSLVSGSEELWTTLTNAQRSLLLRRWNEHMIESEIEAKLGI